MAETIDPPFDLPVQESVPPSTSVRLRPLIYSEHLDPLSDIDGRKGVVVVEGDRSQVVSAIGIVTNEYNAVGWTEPANVWDWSALAGRKVIVWPDNQPADREKARELAAYLSTLTSPVYLIDPGKAPASPAGFGPIQAERDNWMFSEWKAWANDRVIDAKPAAPKPMPPALTARANGHKPEPDGFLTHEELGIQISSKGKAPNNIATALTVLRLHPATQGKLWFDSFHGKIFTTRGLDQGYREWTDIDTITLTSFFQSDLRIESMSTENVWAAVQQYAHENTRNEPRDWILSLKWDGKPRIERFFVDYLGVHESEYSLTASRNFWICLPARIMDPGCKVDNMVILESKKQGKFKSQTVEAIGGKWAADVHTEVTDKDFYNVIQGKLLIEISELSSFSRADKEAIKSMLSRRTDRFRAPYGRTAKDYPRMCIFLATTNESTYFEDPTGARRYWPVKVGWVDLAAIMRDREQLFAEAYAVYSRVALDATKEQREEAGAAWWIMPLEATEAEQDARRTVDSLEEDVNRFLDGREEEKLTLNGIAADGLGLTGHLDIILQRRIGRALRLRGWEAKNIREGNKVKRVWTYEPEVKESEPDF